MRFDPPEPRSLAEYEALPVLDLAPDLADRSTIPLVMGGSGIVCPLVPNVSDWRTGDLVLTRSALSSPVAIYQFLLRGLPRGSARLTHVGLYDGDGHVWEANPAYNIRMSTVASVLGSAPDYRVFRLPGDRIERERLTEICRFLRDTRRYPSYAEFIRPQTLAKLGSRLLRRSAVGGADADVIAGSLVCSSFAFHALNVAACRAIQINAPFIVPADFARPDLFDPVPLTWCRAPPLANGPR